MVILAIPFVFSQPRSAGVGFRLFVGIMLGLAFFVLNRGFGFYSLLHGFPPVIGALLPTLLFFLLSLVLLRRVA
jgi:lipopolysaccharide export system permease protein